MKESLEEVLGEFTERMRYSAGQLAALSNISKRTIANWLDGTTSKPRTWQDVVKLAAVLHLNESEADRLLEAANRESLAELRQIATNEEDLSLFEPWKPESPPPFQPPHNTTFFVGREKEFTRLVQALLSGKFVNVCHVRGMGGVGKTAVALNLAYHLRPHFPDGVLWANLASSDPMTILNTFATTYGKGEEASKLTNEDSRSNFVRGILASKQVLVILDDAQNSRQLNLLLPPSTGKTAVIITTRHDLTAADGFERLELKPFSPKSGHSLQLFGEYLGANRVRENKESIQQIADILGHLPLALTVAAGRLAYSPGQTIDNFLAQIQQQEGRLNHLIREDRGIRLSFDLSYAALSSEMQHFFATLGVFGGESFSVKAVTAVTNMSLNAVQKQLQELVRLSLVQADVNNRYSLHTLLRDYAREKIAQPEIYSKMVHYFVSYTKQNEHNYDKLDIEISNILSALKTAVDHNLAPSIIQGIHNLYPYLEMRGQHNIIEHYGQQAVQAAHNSNDASGAAMTLANLGHLAYLKDEYAEAEEYLQAGLNAVGQIDAPELHSRLLYVQASVFAVRGEYPQAEATLLEALTFAQRSEEIKEISDILMNLGRVVALGRGDYDQVEKYLNESYRLAQQIGDVNRIGNLLTIFGSLSYERGQWQQAEKYYSEASDLNHKMGNLRGEVNLLNNLGVMAQDRGNFAQAENYFKSGLSVAQKIKLNDMIVLLSVNLGDVCREQKKFQAANDYLEQAIRLAREINNNPNLSYALSHLGATAVAQGNYAAAKIHLQEGLSLAVDTQNPWSLFTAYRWQGELFQAQAQYEEAQVHWIQARDVAQQAGIEPLLGIALYGLARNHFAQGDLNEAFQIGNKGLAIFESLNYYLHKEMADWLKNIPQH